MFTPPEALGVALLISGGHALAHAPEQLDFPLLSATHRYSARPDAPVRYVPSDPFAVPIETLEGDAVDPYGDELAAGALAPELALPLLLPQAATNNATPTTATVPASLDVASLRLAIMSLLL